MGSAAWPLQLAVAGAATFVAARISWAVLEGPCLTVKDRFHYGAATLLTRP
jgi:hypothetical protein